MSNSITLDLFRGCSEKELHDAIEASVADLDGRVAWHSDNLEGIFLGVSSRADVHAVHLGHWNPYPLMKKAAARLGCVWLEARIQCSSHWDYSLMRGEEELHSFSTLPEHFSREPEHLAMFRGDPEGLAAAWGVPLERIAGYLKQWGDGGDAWGDGPLPGMKSVTVDPKSGDVAMRLGFRRTRYTLTGKAYPTDEFEYGDYWQMRDFVRALGADWPPSFSPGQMLDADPDPGDRHRLFFPDNRDIYQDGWYARLMAMDERRSLWTRVKRWFGGGGRIEIE